MNCAEVKDLIRTARLSADRAQSEYDIVRGVVLAAAEAQNATAAKSGLEPTPFGCR